METQSRKAHPLLRAALVAIYKARGAEGRPPPPYHLGPPTPQLSARDTVLLALWLVEDAIRARPEDAAMCISVMGAIRTIADGALEHLALDDPRVRRLADTSRGMTLERAPQLLMHAVNAVQALANNSQASVISTAESMITTRTTAFGDTEARAFVQRLDDEIMRLECQHVVRLLEPKPPEPRRVLWRWGPPEASRAEQWIVRHEKGHAWIAAAPRSVPGKGKRAFFEGTLDDALSCVPDGLFASAADIALRRDVM